jgi:hypothetical protein
MLDEVCFLSLAMYLISVNYLQFLHPCDEAAGPVKRGIAAGPCPSTMSVVSL